MAKREQVKKEWTEAGSLTLSPTDDDDDDDKGREWIKRAAAPMERPSSIS